MTSLNVLTADNADAGHVPELGSYDWIVVSSSAGKDSQAMLDYVVELAKAEGILDRVVVAHSDLGEAEWQGTGELAAEQAAAYGLRFELVSRVGGVAARDSATYRKGESYGSIRDYATRRNGWPTPSLRWCTSEFKRGPLGRVYTALAAEWRKATGEKRPCRVLDCQGLRAEESAARESKPQLSERVRSTRQAVDTWLPIQLWSTEQVWSRIRASGVRHHPAYDLGMSRLSCVFCIFAPRASLVTAGRANPELLDRHVETEETIRAAGGQWKFKANLSLAEIRQAVADGEVGADSGSDEGGCWNM